MGSMYSVIKKRFRSLNIYWAGLFRNLTFVLLCFAFFCYYSGPNFDFLEEPIGKSELLRTPVVDGFVKYFSKGAGDRIIISEGNGRDIQDLNGVTGPLNGLGFRTLGLSSQGRGDTWIRNNTLEAYAQPIFDTLSADLYEQDTKKYCLVGSGFNNFVFREALTMASKSEVKKLPNAIVLLGITDGQIPPHINKANKAVFNTAYWPSHRVKTAKHIYFADDSEFPKGWRRGWRNLFIKVQFSMQDNVPPPDWSDIVDIPILVIHGDQDRFLPKDEFLQVVEQYFPKQTEVHILKGAGHALVPEKRDAINQVMLPFLKKNCRSADSSPE